MWDFLGLPLLEVTSEKEELMLESVLTVPCVIWISIIVFRKRMCNIWCALTLTIALY